MNIVPHPDAELSTAQLEKLAHRLISMRHDLLGSINSLKGRVTAKQDCDISDAADAASLQEDRIRAEAMANHHQQTVKEIDAALLRMQNGQYGVSEASGEPIPFERLLLIPWARTTPDDQAKSRADR